jgi:hypothetical protein
MHQAGQPMVEPLGSRRVFGAGRFTAVEFSGDLIEVERFAHGCLTVGDMRCRKTAVCRIERLSSTEFAYQRSWPGAGDFPRGGL